MAGEIDGVVVPGVPRRGGRRPAQHDRDVRGDEARRRQLALGRRSRLRANRQAARCRGSTEVALQFQPVPHLAFGNKLARDLRPDAMVLRIQPDEGITLGARREGTRRGVQAENRGHGLLVRHGVPRTRGRRIRAAAARRDDRRPHLVHPHRRGRSAWRIVDPFLTAWSDGDAPLSFYAAGTWGPRDSDLMLDRGLRRWRNQ